MYMVIFFMKKIKQIIAVLLVLLQCFFLVLPVSAEENEKTEVKESSLYSKACALTDGESGRLLYGKKEDVPMANASTTKFLPVFWQWKTAGWMKW